MVLTQKVRLRNHGRIVSQLETRIPQRAFAGATLDLLYSGEGLDQLDDATRDQVIGFAEDFLACGCDGCPHCGHPEQAFLQYVLELRAEGHSPESIVDTMGYEYGLTAYPGDVLSFLDEAVRLLDAFESLARVEGNESARAESERKRRSLEGH